MAKAKRPTQDQMAELLNQPHFADSASAPVLSVSTDPILPTPMVLEVDQVRTYDHNPRKTPNSEYQAIYESVKANGLDQVLTISRRPGDSHYMVFAGGNTRLEIVQRLWRETGDEKFRKANFLFRPWSSDLETLLAHLRENDQRGDLTFIDRAHALVELRQMLEQELGLVASEQGEAAENEPDSDKQDPCQGGVCQWHNAVGTESAKSALLSDLRFASLLKERGYSIRRETLYLYWYAVSDLADCIPKLLKRGAGRPLIKEIYQLDQAYMATFRFLNNPPSGEPAATEEEARLIFHTLLQRMDAEGELDIDMLRNQLKKELSVTFDETFSTCGMLMVRMADADGAEGLEWFWEMDAQERQREAEREKQEALAAQALEQADENPPASIPESVDLDDEVPEFDLKPWSASTPAITSDETPETTTLPSPAETGQQARPLDARPLNMDLPLEDATDDPVEQQEGDATQQSRLGNSNYSFFVAETLQLPLPPMPQTVPELRQRMVELARELFERAQLGHNMIHPIPSGVGFIVMPVTRPIAEDFDGLPNDCWIHAMHVWQEMTEFSQQFMYPCPAHRFIPTQWREAFPNFTAAMERAEWDDKLFYEYRLDDWKLWGKEMPYLSGFHGRESRACRIFAHRDFGSVSMAYYMQLVETYRMLHGVMHGDIWRDA